MRKIIALTMVSMDGVMQAPSGPEEDPSLGFEYGGWAAPYSDEALGEVLDTAMEQPFDLLLGRKTYDIFAPYWPEQHGTIADAFNKAVKYVVSDGPADLTWKDSVLISGDVTTTIKTLKHEAGPALQVWGSSKLLQTLLKHDLVDEMHIWTFPVTIGSGQRLFGEGTLPATFELLEAKVLPSGVIAATYKRAGTLAVGSLK